MKRLVVVLAACGSSPAPVAAPPLDQAPAIRCDEAQLRSFADRLGDKAPEIRVRMSPRGRTMKHACPAGASDERCIELARRSVTLGAGESIRGVEVADVRISDSTASEWVMTMLVDGKPVTERFPDESTAAAHARELRAKGHTVEPQSGELVTAPDRRVPDRRVAQVAIDAPSAQHRVAVIRISASDAASLARAQDMVAAANLVIMKWHQLRDRTGMELEVGCP